jgi:hypothetical protein
MSEVDPQPSLVQQEFKKLDSRVLLAIIGATWGVQPVAAAELESRGELTTYVLDGAVPRRNHRDGGSKPKSETACGIEGT